MVANFEIIYTLNIFSELENEFFKRNRIFNSSIQEFNRIALSDLYHLQPYLLGLPLIS
jgi:hypothetical protein